MRNATTLIVFILAAATSGAAAAYSLPAAGLIEELGYATTADMSLDQAVAMVEKRYGARVVRADVREEDGRKVYVLRLLSDGSGRVWTVRVDAASGSLL